MASADALRILRGLQASPDNKVCVDCNTRNPSWASVSYGIFMCLECAGHHRNCGVHISFVRSVTMDSWSADQLKKMQLGGNDKLNTFLKQYGVDKFTDVKDKYNTQAAGYYRDKIRAEVEGRPYTAPAPSASNRPTSSAGMPRNRSFTAAKNDDWDDWGDSANSRSGHRAGMKSDVSTPNLRAGNEYTMAQLETSSRNKEAFFANKLAENATRPDHLPPNQGGKYVGFGSGPAPPKRATGGVEDVTQMLSKTVMGVTTAAGAAVRSTSSVINDGRVAETAAVVAQRGGAAFNSLWNLSKKALVTVASSVETVARDNGYRIDLGAKDMERTMQQNGGAMPAGGAGSSSGRYGGFGSDSVPNGNHSGGGGSDQWGSTNGNHGGSGGGSGYGSERSNNQASTSGGGAGFSGFDDASGGDEWGSWDQPSGGRGGGGASSAGVRPSSRTSNGSGGSRRVGASAAASSGGTSGMGGSKKWEGKAAVGAAPQDDEWGKW